MPTERTTALSDGVFAIAATLLVLDLHRLDPTSGHLMRDFLNQWPSFVAYAMSFVMIGICWVNHHSLFSSLARLDRPFLFLNLNLLLFIGVIPYPTAFLADAFGARAGERAAILLFGGSMVATSTAFALLWTYVARHQRFMLKHEGDVDVNARLRRTWGGVLLYLATTGVALANPAAGLVTFALIAIYYIHPGWRRSKDGTAAIKETADV